jgi:hypothetical protein
MSKDLFAREALAQIPKLLTLLDRNPHSPTYGCFDRNYWHYRIIDFPSGMAQEFAYPLALASKLDIAGNPFYRAGAIREWVRAAIIFAARSAHKDGSCDDYFPYERAGGAAAFSLLACIESAELLGIVDAEASDFFQKRADWLASHHESGRLTNHQALIALCLELLSRKLNTSRWDEAKRERIERVLAWQSSEGWFQEYEGCDPGYHTLTLSMLAWLYHLNPSPELKESIERAVRLAAEFIHPDGSFGGEYGSRNTYNFFPHGFESAGRWMPEALSVNDRFLKGLAAGLSPCYGDDHIIGHHAWSYLLAWRDFVAERPVARSRPRGRVWLKEAGILIERRDDSEAYIALNKGGLFKIFRGDRLIASDTQISVRAREGSKVKNAVAHLVDQYETHIEDDLVRVRGSLGWAKQARMTTIKLLTLRIAMLAGGRFFPDLVRKLLQKMLVTGKEDAPFTFIRTLRWQDGRWRVSDELSARSWSGVESVGFGCDQTSIYVVMSRTYQAGQLQGWTDLTPAIGSLSPGEPLKVEREF